MKQRQHLFIYDRKEMLVLVLMTIVFSVFTFTLGIHFGKRVTSRGINLKLSETSLVKTIPDQLPTRQELAAKNKLVQQTLQASLTDELQDEVARSEIKIDTPHQVNLPMIPVDPNGGATTLSETHTKPERSEKHKKEKDQETIERREASHNYTLQIGSFPSQVEAKRKLASLEKGDLKPYLREADLKRKGTWYRLYVGSFATRRLAEHVGQKYKHEHKIASFIVSKIQNSKEENKD